MKFAPNVTFGAAQLYPRMYLPAQGRGPRVRSLSMTLTIRNNINVNVNVSTVQAPATRAHLTYLRPSPIPRRLSVTTQRGTAHDVAWHMYNVLYIGSSTL